MKADLKHYTTKLTGSKEERAVSPVIGVILMVAITVILAAVIAAFVLDMGDLDDSAPNAQFEWSQDGGEVTVTHSSGDDIDQGPIKITGDIDSDPISDPFSDPATAGDEEVITLDDNSGGTIQIIWESDGSSTILDEYEFDSYT